MAVASVGAFNKYADCWTLLTLVVRLTRHFNTKLKSLILDWIWSFPSRELIHFEVLTWRRKLYCSLSTTYNNTKIPNVKENITLS